MSAPAAMAAESGCSRVPVNGATRADESVTEDGEQSGARPGLKGWLERRFGMFGVALFAFLGCTLAVGIVGAIALLLKWPLLGVSLGPTVLLFFEKGMQPSVWPRNVVIGHAVAIGAGWICLALFGLSSAPDVLEAGVTPARLGAAALSVGLTGLVEHLLAAAAGRLDRIAGEPGVFHHRLSAGHAGVVAGAVDGGRRRPEPSLGRADAIVGRSSRARLISPPRDVGSVRSSVLLRCLVRGRSGLVRERRWHAVPCPTIRG